MIRYLSSEMDVGCNCQSWSKWVLSRGYRTLEYHQTFTSSAIRILIYKPHSFKREAISELNQSLGQMRMQTISKARDKKPDMPLRDKPSGGGSWGGSALTLRFVHSIGPIARTLLENDRNWTPFRDEACLKLFHGISILCETSCNWSLFGGFNDRHIKFAAEPSWGLSYRRGKPQHRIP